MSARRAAKNSTEEARQQEQAKQQQVLSWATISDDVIATSATEKSVTRRSICPTDDLPSRDDDERSGQPRLFYGRLCWCLPTTLCAQKKRRVFAVVTCISVDGKPLAKKYKEIVELQLREQQPVAARSIGKQRQGQKKRYRLPGRQERRKWRRRRGWGRRLPKKNEEKKLLLFLLFPPVYNLCVSVCVCICPSVLNLSVIHTQSRQVS
jgi:hypothetical protein